MTNIGPKRQGVHIFSSDSIAFSLFDELSTLSLSLARSGDVRNTHQGQETLHILCVLLVNFNQPEYLLFSYSITNKEQEYT